MRGAERAARSWQPGITFINVSGPSRANASLTEFLPLLRRRHLPPPGHAVQSQSAPPPPPPQMPQSLPVLGAHTRAARTRGAAHRQDWTQQGIPSIPPLTRSSFAGRRWARPDSHWRSSRAGRTVVSRRFPTTLRNRLAAQRTGTCFSGSLFSDRKMDGVRTKLWLSLL